MSDRGGDRASPLQPQGQGHGAATAWGGQQLESLLPFWIGWDGISLLSAHSLRFAHGRLSARTFHL